MDPSFGSVGGFRAPAPAVGNALEPLRTALGGVLVLGKGGNAGKAVFVDSGPSCGLRRGGLGLPPASRLPLDGVFRVFRWHPPAVRSHSSQGLRACGKDLEGVVATVRSRNYLRW